MTRRLLLSYIAVTLVVLILLELPLGLFYAQRERDRLASDVEHDASVIATIYEDTLEKHAVADPTPADEYSARTSARVVVVDVHGISIVDTEQEPPRDFSTRPEIAAALKGTSATGTRPSDTLGTELLYVALPVASGGVVHGAVRLTLETDDVDRHIHRFWAGLVAVGAIVLAVMALVGWVIARSVTRPVRKLTETAARFAGGDLTSSRAADAGGPPEVRALSDTMEMMAVRLAALLDEQRAFVADASHQLRTPLTALRLRLENLQSHLDTASAAELDTAIDEISRLAGLVSDLLQLARADRPEPLTDVDLAHIARERVEIWTAVADGQSVRLQLDAPNDVVLARATPSAVEQILDNLLDNALRAAPPGSQVVVALETGDLQHRLSVADHGTGLSDADKQLAVRRFWRGSSTTAGTGLGLAIATALAAQSGGSLALTDATGGGLAAVLTLRAARPATGDVIAGTDGAPRPSTAARTMKA